MCAVHRGYCEDRVLRACRFLTPGHGARRVSGGLDSLVLGEGQILAQVKQVYKVGQTCAGFGRHLNGLFKQAITAGKRVRAETSISSGAVSVSSAAAELAQLKLPSGNFADAKVGVQLRGTCVWACMHGWRGYQALSTRTKPSMGGACCLCATMLEERCQGYEPHPSQKGA